MTDVDDAAGAEGDPIDAQFEPAPPSADHVVLAQKSNPGPGWTSLIITGVLATILGAGVGAGLSGMLNGAKGGINGSETALDATRYQTQIADLETNQQKLGSRLAALSADLEKAEARLGEEIVEAVAHGSESGQSTAISEVLASLSARVDLLSALPEGEGEDTGILSARLLTFEQALADLQAGQGTRADALSSLTSRLESLEAASGEGQVDQAQLVSLYEDISALKVQLAEAVSANADREILNARIERLETRTAAVQSASASGLSTGKVALALLSLEAASESGVPFLDAIATLDTAGVPAARLVDLAAIAPTGAPTHNQLQDMFRDAVLVAQAQEQEDTQSDDAQSDDGWGWVRSTFGDSVKITRSDGSESDPENTFATFTDTTGTLLANGNVAAAMAQLDSLTEDEREVFADWQHAAERRVRLEAGLMALRASMLEQER